MSRFLALYQQEEEKQSDGWEFYRLRPDLVNTLESKGFLCAFPFFKKNWPKMISEKIFIEPYEPELAEFKNLLTLIFCLNVIKPMTFTVQSLIVFLDDDQTYEFYQFFEPFAKKMNIKTAVIMDEESIVGHKTLVSEKSPEIIVGSVKRIEYLIKKHYLNVFTIKCLLFDISIREKKAFPKGLYEDISLLIPETARKVIFYEENELFNKKNLKFLEKIL